MGTSKDVSNELLGLTIEYDELGVQCAERVLRLAASLPMAQTKGKSATMSMMIPQPTTSVLSSDKQLRIASPTSTSC